MKIDLLSRYAVIGTLLLVLLTGRSSYAIDGRMIHIGYPMSVSEDMGSSETAGRDKYRPGCWIPVQVELFNEEGAPLFEGRLRITVPDRDGDLAVTEEPVAVRGQRTYWLYVPAGMPATENPFRVELLDSQGRAVKFHDRNTGAAYDRLQTKEPPLILNSEEMVVLDISSRPVSSFYRLVSSTAREKTPADITLSRPLVIARQSAAQLPPHWCALDMVDVVVWDAADPATMTDAARQLPALIEWVRRGGTLVLGVGRTWQNVQKSGLATLLPGELSSSQTTDRLPELAEYLVKGTDLKNSITICPVNRQTLRAGVRTFYQRENDPQARILLCRQTVGRGQVVYVGAELRDLYELGGKRDDLTMRLLGLRKLPEDEQRPVQGDGRELFPYVSGAVGFETQTPLYFLFTIVFVVCYILLSTLGTWSWLKKREWQRYNWLAFAAVVVLASLLSLGAVRAIRGIGRASQELCVVDLAAGSYAASAKTFYGVKTSSHEWLDLLLPVDWTNFDDGDERLCTLKPLPATPQGNDAVYVVPYEYHIRPNQARLDDVPFRATLKQFEGSWRGEIAGQITASLTCTRDGSSYVLDANSWIKNELGVDLYGCILIQAVTDPSPNIPRRWGPQTLRAYQIGDPAAVGVFRNQRTLAQLDKIAYGESGRRSGADYALRDFQSNWARMIGARAEKYQTGDGRERLEISADRTQAALLLASTFTEFKPAGDNSLLSGGMLRTYLRDFDVSELLRRDVMLLVGFSATPGPARICCRTAGTNREFRPIRPSSSLTMYRVLIPITQR